MYASVCSLFLKVICDTEKKVKKEINVITKITAPAIEISKKEELLCICRVSYDIRD
jgi:adenylate kinase family enzyme